MKKKISVAVVVSIVFFFISCKKDYTCECTGVYTDGTPNSTTDYSILDKTKSKAEDECAEYSVKLSNVEYSCKLK